MEEENKSKKKLVVKAETSLQKKLLLKKENILPKYSTNILKLEKEVIKFKNNYILNKSLINFKKKKDKSNIISCNALSKSFDGRPILKSISFKLKKGQILGLLGPNGSGKTTLFKILAGEIKPDAGEIIYFNELINDLPIHTRARKGISFLQQHKGLFDNLTAYENLYAVLELHIKDKDKIEQKIFKLLSYFGLNYLINIKAKHFSGGEQKKIAALQRVCNQNIQCLLLDEPLSALDPLSISSIKNFIIELKNMGLSMIITEHNIAAIQDILDYCIIIRDGEIMTKGTVQEIKKDDNAIKYYLGTDFKI